MNCFLIKFGYGSTLEAPHTWMTKWSRILTVSISLGKVCMQVIGDASKLDGQHLWLSFENDTSEWHEQHSLDSSVFQELQQRGVEDIST